MTGMRARYMLKSTIMGTVSMRSMNRLVERTRSYVAKAHEGQKYGEEFPYFVHLWTAYSVAVRFGIVDPVILSAVLGHDLLEDTTRTYEDIATFLSPDVADMIALVSEPRGLTRKEKHAISYPRIARSNGARIVKLCDRISHVEFGGKKVTMYRKEHAGFKQALGASLTDVEGKMWDYLDDLLIEIDDRSNGIYTNDKGRAELVVDGVVRATQG